MEFQFLSQKKKKILLIYIDKNHDLSPRNQEKSGEKKTKTKKNRIEYRYHNIFLGVPQQKKIVKEKNQVISHSFVAV